MFEEYVIRRGDILSEIALRVYGKPSWTKCIAAANADEISNPDQIFVGQTLKPPSSCCCREFEDGQQAAQD